jgi:mono/diheme cytochrome c family protein
MRRRPAARIAVLFGVIIGGVSVALTLMGADLTMPREKNIHVPRVPVNQLAAVKKMVNPVPDTPETLEKGKALYTMACAACHGADGRGDGPLTKKTTINPAPRNFANTDFQRLRTDGELFWVLKHGSHGTEMMRMDFFFTDQELWTLVRYLRTFGPGTGAPTK